MPNADGVPNCTSLGYLGSQSGFTVSDCSVPPPPPPPNVKQSEVQYNLTNNSVTLAQQALIANGFGIAAGATGFFGDQTKAAMNSFESAVGQAQTQGHPSCFTLGALGSGTPTRFTVTCDVTQPPPPPPSDNEPLHNYTRITYNGGVTINQRTSDMLDRAVVALTAYQWTPYLTQGSYNSSVPASGGTHDGGGVCDIRVTTMTENGRNLCVQALRRVGFAAWYRTPAEGFDYHIHAVAIGDREMSAPAANQVQDYFNGLNGLANNAGDTLPSSYKTPVPMWPGWCNKYNF